MKFKIGDEVMIKKDSEYFNLQGHHGIGTITHASYNNEYEYGVRFKDNYSNEYREEDLKYTKVTNWRKRMEDRP